MCLQEDKREMEKDSEPTSANNTQVEPELTYEEAKKPIHGIDEQGKVYELIVLRVKVNWQKEWFEFGVFHSEGCACDLESADQKTLEISFDSGETFRSIKDIECALILLDNLRGVKQ